MPAPAAGFTAEPTDYQPPPPIGLNTPVTPSFEPVGGPPPIPAGMDGMDGMEFMAPTSFAPKTPPPVFMTWDRMLRGTLLGSLITVSIGAAVGGGLAATGLVIPLVAAIVMGLVSGTAVRFGMGGRSAARTRAFAMLTVLVVVASGFFGLLTGSWLVDRFTGERAEITRKDLKVGREDLTMQLGRAQKIGDATRSTTLETRLNRIERLEASSDPQLEDYLWIQQAQINQPLVAYGKLRVTVGPVVKFGLDQDAIEMPKNAASGVVGLELLIALFLAWRGVRAKR